MLESQNERFVRDFLPLHYITCIYWRYMHTCLHAYIRTYTLWMLYHGFVDEALSVTNAGSLHCPESPRPTKAAHLPPNGDRVPAGSKETSGSPRTYSSLLATGLRTGDSRVVTHSVCCWWWTKTKEILEIAKVIPPSSVHGRLAAQDWNALEKMEGDLSNQILGWTQRVARNTEPFVKCVFFFASVVAAIW